MGWKSSNACSHVRTGRAVNNNREVITISTVVPEVFHDPQVAGLVHLVAGHDQRGGVVLAPRVVVQPAEHAQPERAAHLSSVSKLVFYSQSTRTLISERKIFCQHTINVKNICTF